MRFRTRSPRGRSPSGRMSRWPARITSKELAPIHSVKNGILQNACSTRPRVVGQGDWGPQGMTTTGGGGLARVPNLRVCKHHF